MVVIIYHYYYWHFKIYSFIKTDQLKTMKGKIILKNLINTQNSMLFSGVCCSPCSHPEVIIWQWKIWQVEVQITVMEKKVVRWGSNNCYEGCKHRPQDFCERTMWTAEVKKIH